MTDGASDQRTGPAPVGAAPEPMPGVDGASGRAGAARPVSRRRTEKQPLPAWQETVLLVAMAVILALVIKTFFLQAFYIPSGSMREALKVNDRILVEKVTYWFADVHRGDIVVFDDPANWLGEEDGQSPSNVVTKGLATIGLYPTGGHLVKRVIGIEGDTVSCNGGRVFVNGKALDEGGYVTLAKEACRGRWTAPPVPHDHIWVMGDNRDNSADSRAHMGEPGGGFIPSDDVVGKVFVVAWPPKDWSLVDRPGAFDDPRLDQAAGLISSSCPGALALGLLPAFRRRRNRRTSSR